MAEYKAIRGHTIRTIDGDASPLIAGDIWYNSSAKKIKGVKLAAGSWATGGELNTARYSLGGAQNSTQTAGLVFGGQTSSTNRQATCEEYDGSSWTESGDLADARTAIAGAGIQTAALAMGGDSPGYPTATELYDGSSWSTSPVTLGYGKDNGASFGTQTATIFATGYKSGGETDEVELFNGSSWTEVGKVNSKRSYVDGCGTSTAGIIAAGSAPPYTGVVETWDGTSWTEVADLNTARANFSIFGVQTSAVGSGGDDGSTPRFTSCEYWDGTSWTEVADITGARKMAQSVGTTTAGLMAAGSNPSNNGMNTSEEWSQSTAAVTFTSS